MSEHEAGHGLPPKTFVPTQPEQPPKEILRPATKEEVEEKMRKERPELFPSEPLTGEAVQQSIKRTEPLLGKRLEGVDSAPTYCPQDGRRKGCGCWSRDERRCVAQGMEQMRLQPCGYGHILSNLQDGVFADKDSSGKPGMKNDQGKLEWDLLPDAQLEPVVQVLMYGAREYAPENWKQVEDPIRRYYNATRRHLAAWKNGEKIDKDSGENHLAHAVCNLLFMLYFDKE